MRGRMWLAGWAILVCGLLTACTGVSVRSTSYGGRADLSSRVPFYDTQVVGNPRGGDDAAFAQQVLEWLNGANVGLRTNRLTAGGATITQYREVLVFHTGNSAYAARALCGDVSRLGTQVAASSGVRLDGAVCRGDDPVRTVNASSADAANLENLVKQAQIALFPIARSRSRNNDGGSN